MAEIIIIAAGVSYVGWFIYLVIDNIRLGRKLDRMSGDII